MNLNPFQRERFDNLDYFFSLPSGCSDKSCGAGFKGGKNLFQDTDGGIYCSRCGVIQGRAVPGLVPFKRCDDNLGKGSGSGWYMGDKP